MTFAETLAILHGWIGRELEAAVRTTEGSVGVCTLVGRAEGSRPLTAVRLGRLGVLLAGIGLEAGGAGLVAVVERLAEEPPATPIEPARIALAQPALAALVDDQPPAAVSPQLSVRVALAQPRCSERIERAADPEVDRGALDRVRERRLRVIARADVLAGHAEERQATADVDRRQRQLAVFVDRARAKRLRQRLERGRPALAADEVEPVEDEPRVNVGCDLRAPRRRVSGS